MSNSYYNNSIFANYYLFFYSIFISVTVFMDSEIKLTSIGYFINPLYIIIECIFIIMNMTLILKSNNIIKIMITILLLSGAILPYVLFHSQIISPFFLVIYLMILNSNEFTKSINFVKIDTYSKFYSIIFIIFLGFINVFPKVTVTRNGNNGSTLRYCLGFSSPNVPDLMMLSLVFSSILLLTYHKYKNLSKLILNVFLILVYLIIFYYTNSRECIVAMIMLLIGLVIIYNNVIKRIIILLPILTYLFCIITSIYFTFYCHSSMFFDIDNLTTNRLSSWVIAFNLYPVKLLGRIGQLTMFNEYKPDTIFSSNMSKAFTVASLDNGYLFNIMALGIIGFIIFSVFVIYSLYKVDISKVVNSRKSLLCLFFIIIFITLLSVQCKILYTLLPLALIICNSNKSNNISKINKNI